MRFVQAVCPGVTDEYIHEVYGQNQGGKVEPGTEAASEKKPSNHVSFGSGFPASPPKGDVVPAPDKRRLEQEEEEPEPEPVASPDDIKHQAMDAMDILKRQDRMQAKTLEEGE